MNNTLNSLFYDVYLRSVVCRQEAKVVIIIIYVRRGIGQVMNATICSLLSPPCEIKNQRVTFNPIKNNVLYGFPFKFLLNIQ